MVSSQATQLQKVVPARIRSFWLQQALASEVADGRSPALAGANRCDVCVIGGGYTGLWTAIRLKELDPSIEVTLLEADFCGAGASGRNGGLVLGWWQKLRTLSAWFGEEEAIRLATAAAEAIDDIGAFCLEHDIDAHFRKAGILRTATTPAQVQKLEPSVRASEERGLSVYQRLTQQELQERAGSAVYLAGVFEANAATVQPAFLVRGLRRVALDKGIRIFEHSPVVNITTNDKTRLRTLGGIVIADKVVLATNAWAANLPELRRSVVVLSSDMVVTVPIPSRLHEIGWNGGESITDGRMMVHYHQATRDGRIAIGRGSGALSLGGRFGDSFNRSQARADVVEEGLRYLYPTLSDVPVTHSWAGPIDRTRTSILLFGTLDRHPSVTYGLGFSGTGVAPTLVAAKVLASRLLELQDEWSESPINRGALVDYPPEPARFAAGLALREVVRRKEEGEQAGKSANRLQVRLATLVSPRQPSP